ncbi:hypothetical protein [uncultured Gimesia sp.]|uniref:hypothetical protein n=1 Tax=uncultured Gimesia sp. TaxID=1678688 RepID=UPI00260EAAC6|nr:hypothetical protein [uncultured Gimesia sp.]
MKLFSYFLRRPVWYALLLLFGAQVYAERILAAGAPDETLFELSIEANENDPRLCLFVVTAKDEQFWTALKKADEEQFQSVLSLKRKSQTDSKLPAILGRYRVNEDRLEFKPAFPLVRNSRYRAVFDPRLLTLPVNIKATSLDAAYSIPLPNAKPPRVLAIYPSGRKLPANHLKFYIQFSEPMQQGDIFRYFSLFNKTQNRPVPRPFRHTELWSPDGKQLTLWFHPGRQKVGVNLNVELGAILNRGDEYELRISQKWAGLSGLALGVPFKKTFSAIAMDERQPVIEKWKLSTPQAGTLKPLICQLGAPLDYALLHSQLTVQTEAGEKLSGTIRLNQHESIWRFIPDEAWQPGRYRLVVGTVLEDLAGNSIARPFAIDLTKEKNASSIKGEFVSREFLISK